MPSLRGGSIFTLRPLTLRPGPPVQSPYRSARSATVRHGRLRAALAPQLGRNRACPVPLLHRIADAWAPYERGQSTCTASNACLSLRMALDP